MTIAEAAMVAMEHWTAVTAMAPMTAMGMAGEAAVAMVTVW